ncbi:peptide/nickel transport system substrate-binding protein [Asanoa ferruginea]|uniref:Peptide/nickel transport system substrate-binding protein n=1 Tax=Asanoa ferruginea TaxID=53367 RepID=A0A3D9ZND2_9ACTN|nr:ABC transporter substrate-binding protein [Asanoa ferruginea]REF98876.1 peptide/nickel transport system substrate-binding protein [Asanoa ferruginea]GIF46442.1 peptide-binding protein [Asanoa ferruginea]
MGAEPAIARIGRAADVVTLNPIMFTDLFSAPVVTQLYDHLLSLDDDYRYQAGGLVEDWTISPDGETVDFLLRPGVRFHDGHELTAEDAAFTFQAALDPANESPRRSQLIVGGAEMGFAATGRYRLRIWLPKASASCLASLACLPLLPKHRYGDAPLPDHPLNNSPIGSGAFRFVEWRPGEVVSIAGYADYFDGRPPLDRVDFMTFGDIEAAVKALVAGEIDYVPNVPADLARALADVRGVDVHWNDAPVVSYLAFNLDDPLLRELRVRQAVAHAIDREGLIHRVLGGAGTVADTLVPPGTVWRNDNLLAREYAVSEANALLDAAGWRFVDTGDVRRDSRGTALELTILTVAGDRAKERSAEFIAADLRRVGIHATVRALGMGPLLRDHIYPRQYSAAVLALNPDPDPAFLNTFYHSAMLTPVGWNRCAYRNPAVDDLLDKGLSIRLGQDERKTMYDAVQRIVLDELPHVTLYNPRVANVTSSRVVLPPTVLSHGDFLAALNRWRVAGSGNDGNIRRATRR